jgi:arsenite-transporting ATPase
MGRMRILLYAGKGGVGKTCVAAATGVVTARMGMRTLVMSLDPAHSLSDAFDLDRFLMDKNRGQPISVGEKLWIQELDIHEEMGKSWGEVQRYIALLLNTSGIDDILAEELAVLPGMDEVAALLHVNRYVKERAYDLIILDCAPTAESLRFVSLPKALEWYMRKIFRLERRVVAYVRPVARRFMDVPLPEDGYFADIERLYQRLQGIDGILTDPAITSVRLVTNPEKMVLRETQRAFMFFCLHQLSVDAVIINRIFPPGSGDPYLQVWQKCQQEYLELARTYFHPVEIFEVSLSDREILGYDRLLEFGRNIYGDREPAQFFSATPPFQFLKEDGRNLIKLHLPFVGKEEVDLSKIGDELIVRVGNIKKSIVLPRAFATLEPKKARLEEEHLLVEFGGSHEREQEGSRGGGESPA